jgi:hypothetical protein
MLRTLAATGIRLICPASSGAARTAATLVSVCEVLREGLAALGHYEGLRSKGIPHDAAIRSAFDTREPGVAARHQQLNQHQRELANIGERYA